MQFYFWTTFCNETLQFLAYSRNILCVFNNPVIISVFVDKLPIAKCSPFVLDAFLKKKLTNNFSWEKCISKAYSCYFSVFFCHAFTCEHKFLYLIRIVQLVLVQLFSIFPYSLFSFCVHQISVILRSLSGSMNILWWKLFFHAQFWTNSLWVIWLFYLFTDWLTYSLTHLLNVQGCNFSFCIL